MLLIYKIGGALGALAYLVLFTAGVVINSAPFRARLTASATDVAAFIAVLLTYTPINVAFLSILAGLIGGCASLLTYHRVGVDNAKLEANALNEQSLIFRTESPVASMLRSLVVYFAFMAGILVTTVDPFTTTTPDQYVRLASAISFFSFIVGYDPTKFQNIINLRLGGRASESDKESAPPRG